MKLVIISGMKLGKLYALLARNNVSTHPRNIARLLFLVQGGFWASVLARLEGARFGQKIRSAAVPEDPIFIIGHWRSGSTLLQQLLSVDPALVTSTSFHVAFPDSFLVAGPFVKPAMHLMLDRYRPMDRVRQGVNEPQEDENALFRMTTESPLERLLFPTSPDYFLLDTCVFGTDKTVPKCWEEAICLFCKKLAVATNRQIVLKNPFNSVRIGVLSRLFPRARFIHIHRHPYAVVPSTVHMWSIMGEQNCLNGKWTAPKLVDVTTVLERTLSAIRRDSADLPEERFCEVRFEHLETNPVATLKDVYQTLGLDFTAKYKEQIEAFLLTVKDYRKGQYDLTQGDKQHMEGVLAHHMAHYGYDS